MIMKIYSIRDNKAGVFNNPIFSPNDEHAKREFEMMYSNAKDGIFVRYPEDFDLYSIGEYNTDTGKIEGIDKVVNIAKGKAFIKNAEDS